MGDVRGPLLERAQVGTWLGLGLGLGLELGLGLGLASFSWNELRSGPGWRMGLE